MTGEKVLEVLDLYELKLQTENRNMESTLPIDELEHLMTMIPKMRAFVAERRMEKVFRWLGFMQGVLWSRDVYTLHALKQHNMPVDDVAED